MRPIEFTQCLERRAAIVESLGHGRPGRDRAVERSHRFAVFAQIVVRNAGHIEEIRIARRELQTLAQLVQRLAITPPLHLMRGENVEEGGMRMPFGNGHLRPVNCGRDVVGLEGSIDAASQRLKALGPRIERPLPEIAHPTNRLARRATRARDYNARWMVSTSKHSMTSPFFMS